MKVCQICGEQIETKNICDVCSILRETHYKSNNKEKWDYYLKKKHTRLLCEICGDELVPGDIKWDRRTNKEPIEEDPSLFILGPLTSKRMKLWDKSDFGLLCNPCRGKIRKAESDPSIIEYLIKRRGETA